MPQGRDDKLLALLPPKGSPYSFDNLSEAETVALEAAFGDGFGDVSAIDSRPLPLPHEIRSGLLEHFFFVRGSSEYDPEEYPDEFWTEDDDRPSPTVSFPLGFVLRRLRLYFGNQMDRFCAHLISEQPDYPLTDRWHLEQLASYRLYMKPWYEFHAVQFIDWIESAQRDVVRKKRPRLGAVIISSFSGELGRLVEQYYWRFRFEGAAITGVGARRGASAGGKARAALHVAKRAVWQRLGLEIWVRRPSLSKIVVAEAIRKQLGEARTAKHIARFIIRPQA